jgi:hypothetical protein
MKMKAAHSWKMLVNINHITWHHMLEDSNLQFNPVHIFLFMPISSKCYIPIRLSNKNFAQISISIYAIHSAWPPHLPPVNKHNNKDERAPLCHLKNKTKVHQRVINSELLDSMPFIM